VVLDVAAKAGIAIAMMVMIVRAKAMTCLIFHSLYFPFNLGARNTSKCCPSFFDFGILKYGVITDESTFFILCCCVL